MPKTAVGEISRIKIEAEPVPEYRIVELPNWFIQHLGMI